ncbi:MAG: beta-ketoacyl-[acyl-carrier-protein] synthase family protein [Fimbriimonadaceae bacterium]|nr:beta-ketoacyl-[acyl-carrier-protein] synthase family protein [Alphaproteobacteria bacterium]
MTRVAITGMGAVSAAGINVGALWNAAKKGLSAVRPLDIPRSELLRVRIAAAVQDFDPTDYLTAEQLSRCDRFTQFTHVAVKEALKQAAIAPDEIKGFRTATIIGTGIGGMNTLDDGYYNYYSGVRRVNPLTIPKVMPSSAASHVSMTHQVTGPCFSVSSACSSGSQSIGIGTQLIRAGIVDRAIVGGSEACITPATMKAWEVMRVLSPDSCRPFSKDRNGMILGEGAGVLILESEAAMSKRHAEPLAWLIGYGTTSDACDIIQPDVEGAAAAMQAALDDAKLSPVQIGYINAHGTGTVLNDINEARAIRRVFGDHADVIPVSSTKQVIGHTLGASGALEFIVTVSALQENTIPPHINLTEIDPKCSLNLSGNEAVSRYLTAAISNSFAFGGVNASLIASAVG